MSTETGPQGPGGGLVPRIWIIITCAVVTVGVAVTLYSLWAFWPQALPSDMAEMERVARRPQHVSWLWFAFDVEREFLFFVTVAIAGSLGGLIHTIRSFAWYVGNRNFRWSWVPFYMLLPLMGALAGTVFYLVLRAGLFSPSTSVDQASPFGFAAIALIAGLFTPQAFEKLRELAENIFTESRKGEDYEPPRDPNAGG